MEGRRLLRSLTLRNVLSFGPEGQTIDFEPLNVLIGANGSGKTNLIEILGLIRALPRDLSTPFRGGVSEWVWKGEKPDPSFFIGSNWDFDTDSHLQHVLLVTPERRQPRATGEVTGYRPRVTGEIINVKKIDDISDIKYSFFNEGITLGRDLFGLTGSSVVPKVPSRFRTDQSILAQRRDTDRYPELAYLGDRFSEIKIYRSWAFGPGSAVRAPQKADLPSDFLLEDFSNLGLVLDALAFDHRASADLITNFRRIYEGAEEIRVVPLGSDYIEIRVEEENGRSIPAVRLSDGTLRYLCLLAVLCHPEPPPLICIEEPELGLHPDLVSTIAELLTDASQRTQLIVTTHSADLVSALGDVPEAVVVCERGLDGTDLKRLDRERLQKWLERYTLGDLWLMGEIGGTRW